MLVAGCVSWTEHSEPRVEGAVMGARVDLREQQQGRTRLFVCDRDASCLTCTQFHLYNTTSKLKSERDKVAKDFKHGTRSSAVFRGLRLCGVCATLALVCKLVFARRSM